MQRAPLRGSYLLPLLGVVLLVPPVYFAARWARIFSELSGHDDRVAAFGSILPGVLQDPVVSTLFGAACAAAAAAVGAAGTIRLGGLGRQVCAATLGTGGLFFLWYVWTLL